MCRQIEDKSKWDTYQDILQSIIGTCFTIVVVIGVVTFVKYLLETFW